MSRILFFALLLVLALMPRSAQANGRFPASNAVFFDPTDDKTIWIRVTFGLLVSRDSGATWHWICEKGIGFSGQEDPTYVVTPKGTLVGSTFQGLAVSRDKGCNFSFVGGQGKYMLSDLTMRSNGEIVGMSSVNAKGGPVDGVYNFDNQIFQTTDDANTLSVLSTGIDKTLLLESVEVAESDNARLYVSAVRGEGEKRAAFLVVSYNAGMSWTERKIELAKGETAAFIAAVDPKNADRIYLRTHGAVDSHSRLLVSDDAGKTYKAVYESLSPLVGFALGPDKVFLGAREGVHWAPTNTFTFTKGASNEIQCLGLQGGNALWACSNEKSGFFVGLSRHGGSGFDAKLHLGDIKGQLECPDMSTVAKECGEEWSKLKRELGVTDPNDKNKTRDPGGPALKGRGERATRKSSPFGTVLGIAILGLAGWFILDKLRKRK